MEDILEQIMELTGRSYGLAGNVDEARLLAGEFLVTILCSNNICQSCCCVTRQVLSSPSLCVEQQQHTCTCIEQWVCRWLQSDHTIVLHHAELGGGVSIVNLTFIYKEEKICMCTNIDCNVSCRTGRSVINQSGLPVPNAEIKN